MLRRGRELTNQLIADVKRQMFQFSPGQLGHASRIEQIAWCLASGAAALWLAIRFDGLLDSGDFTDFNVIRAAARAVHAHGSPYDLASLQVEPFGAHYKWPPLFAIVIAPISDLPARQLLLLWTSIGLGAYVAAFLILVRSLQIPAGSRLFYLLAIIFLIFQPSFDTLSGGQLELVLLFLFVAAWWGMRGGRSGQAVAGIAIALASLLKVYPVLMLGGFALRRSWIALCVAAAAVALLISLCAAATSWELQRQYWLDVLPHLNIGTASAENQSLYGFFARFFTDERGLDSNATPPDLLPLLLARATGVLVVWVSLAEVIRQRRADVAFVILVPVLIVIHPAAWVHYEVILLLPITVLIAALSSEFRAAWAALMAVAVLLVGLGNETTIRNVHFPLVESYKLYGVVILWVIGIAWARSVRLQNVPSAVCAPNAA